MEKFEHRKPEESLGEKEHRAHNVDLLIDGKKVGDVQLLYYSKPLPLYLIQHVHVQEQYRGQGYSSKIMDYIEALLLQKGKVGLLSDATDHDSPAHGMYARRGWVKVPRWNLYAFNLPKGANSAQLSAVPLRGVI